MPLGHPLPQIGRQQPPLIHRGGPPGLAHGSEYNYLCRIVDPSLPTFPDRLLGYAYFLAERYEEAIARAKKALTLNPNFMLAHVNLALCYAELGRLEEARAEVAEVLRINPHWSLEVVRRVSPYKDPAVDERMIAALRKAGLK